MCLKLCPLFLRLQYAPTARRILVSSSENAVTNRICAPENSSARSLTFMSVPGTGMNMMNSGRSAMMSMTIRLRS